MQQSRVEHGRLSGGRAVNDYASKVAQALYALRNVLAAEHFKHRVDTLAICKFLDCVLVIPLFVVDAVLQTEFADSGELLVRRRSAVGFNAQDLPDLHRGSTDSARDRMDQNARPRRLVYQAGFPVGKVGGEEG